MNDPHAIPPGRQPVDLDAVARDDQLLDLLGAGTPPDSREPLIQALYAWRTELSADLPEIYVRPETQPAAVGRARVNGVKVNGATRNGARLTGAQTNGTKVNGTSLNGKRLNGVPRPAGAPEPDLDTSDEDYTSRPQRGRRRAIVAASLIGLSSGLGGVTVAAADAEPGSALWPITKAIFSETAQDKEAAADARKALRNAREALSDGRVSDAEHYLDEAERKASTTDAATADQLREEADAVRSKIDENEGDSSKPDEPGGDSPTGALPTKPSLPTPNGSSGTSEPAPGDRGGRSGNAKDDERDTGDRPDDGATKGKDAETSSILIDPRILEF